MKQAELTTGESQERRPVGRPTIPYDPEIAEQICEAIATSIKPITTILRETPGAPSYSTWLKWLNSNDELQQFYAQAKAHQADLLVEETIALADEDEGDAEIRINHKTGEPYAVINGRNIRRSEVMIKTRQWAAAKFNPKRYGDSIDVTSGGAPLPAPQLNSVTIDQRVQTIMQLALARREADSLLE